MHCRPTHYFLIKNSQKIIFKKLSVATYRLSLAVQRGNSATVLGTISSIIIIKDDKLQSLQCSRPIIIGHLRRVET